MSITTASIRAREQFNPALSFLNGGLSGSGVVVTASFGANVNKYVRRVNYRLYDENSRDSFASGPKISGDLLPVLASGSTFTVAYWCKVKPLESWPERPGAGSVYGVFEILASPSPKFWSFGFFHDGNIFPTIALKAAIGVQDGDGSGGGTHKYKSTSLYDDGQWHHYIWEVTLGAPTALYVDDTADVCSWHNDPGAPVSVPTSASYDWTLRIANRIRGEISDIAISSASLTSQQRSDLYAATDHSAMPGLFARWHLNEAPALATYGNLNLTCQFNEDSAADQVATPGVIRFNRAAAEALNSTPLGGLLAPFDNNLRDILYEAPYTIQAWVSQSQTDGTQRTLLSYDSRGVNEVYDNRLLQLACTTTNEWKFSWVSGSSVGRVVVTGAFSNVTSSYNAWEHISFVVDNDAIDKFYCTASFYINGVSAGTQVLRRPGPLLNYGNDYHAAHASNSCSLAVGVGNQTFDQIGGFDAMCGGTTLYQWCGLIGKMKIWSRARSADEIAADYADEAAAWLAAHPNDA